MRELIRLLNDLRKETGLQIADRIEVTLGLPEGLAGTVQAHEATIAAEVLATAVTYGTGAHQLDIDGHAVTASLQPV